MDPLRDIEGMYSAEVINDILQSLDINSIRLRPEVLAEMPDCDVIHNCQMMTPGMNVCFVMRLQRKAHWVTIESNNSHDSDES